MGLKVTNNAFGTLNAGINSTDTVIVLEAGQGARFPVLSAGDYFYATLIDTSNQLEIVKVTARATDTMTVVRAQDGTSSRAYNVNDRFELRPTAALFNEKLNADNPSYTGTLTGTGGASIEGLTVGRGAGAVSTNTAVGASALAANTTGAFNVAVGKDALESNTTASYNTAVGLEAGYANTTGLYETFIGAYAGAGNTTGEANSALGVQALEANTTGGFNTAIGRFALAANTTASNNTAVGYQAAYSNTTGTRNAAFGMQSLYANTTGNYNAALSYDALQSNTTGSNNTAVGYQSLISNTTASNNTAVGYQAGYSNTTGTGNTALGWSAGYTNTTSSNNTYLGAAAGNVATGSGNTFVGVSSGETITTGAKNTILGRYNGNQGGLDIRTLSNFIVLSDGDGNPRGYYDNNGMLNQNTNYGSYRIAQFENTNNASGNGIFFTKLGTNCFSTSAYHFIGNTAGFGDVVQIRGNGDLVNYNNSYGSISDVKLKENIVDASPKLADLMQVRVRNYNLKSDPAHKQLGVIAQELEQVFPALIEESPDRNEEGNDLGTTTKSVKYSVFVPMLIKAMQEQQALITQLQAEIATLKGN